MEKLTLLECSKRKLDETYLVVYAIKNEINLKKGEYIEKSEVYSIKIDYHLIILYNIRIFPAKSM